MGGSSSSSTPVQQYWGTGQTAQQQDLGALNSWVYGTGTPTASSSTGGGSNWNNKNNWLYSLMGGQQTGNQYAAGSSSSSSQLWQQYYNQAVKPYSGQLSADLSPLEVQSLSDIGNFNLGDLQTNSSNFLNDILTGKRGVGDLDAWKKQQAYNLQDQITASDQSANLGGMLPSTGRMNASNTLRQRALADLGVEAANIDQANVQNQMQAVPLAEQVAQAPLGVAQQQLAAGAIPRQVQQSALDAQKAEYMRQLQAMGIPYELALQLAFYQPEVANQTQSQSTPDYFGDITKMFSIA